MVDPLHHLLSLHNQQQLVLKNRQLRDRLNKFEATIDNLVTHRPEGRYSMALGGDTLSLEDKLQLVCDLAEYDGG